MFSGANFFLKRGPICGTHFLITFYGPSSSVPWKGAKLWDKGVGQGLKCVCVGVLVGIECNDLQV